ncbi:uncharacterized protein M421DRAFT_389320 [Didymella exigua CBS 183.55]|uniref:Uncharacterized protein n=1 Tax=Didymella exigua CBS 183.55 TaxID=1150837 RepID=A0A6A5RMG5_9PLEO|nr:uncharacterized protein M421DRAFT_389320 [Didymella exigua CBS 183.55]KAF1929605.1 hypothetical protein M421DRAFT_389320 [Didymella exigua CBS 183.55]
MLLERSTMRIVIIAHAAIGARLKAAAVLQIDDAGHGESSKSAMLREATRGHFLTGLQHEEDGVRTLHTSFTMHLVCRRCLNCPFALLDLRRVQKLPTLKLSDVPSAKTSALDRHLLCHGSLDPPSWLYGDYVLANSNGRSILLKCVHSTMTM